MRVIADRSFGSHNPGYTRALLDEIEAFLGIPPWRGFPPEGDPPDEGFHLDADEPREVRP